MKAATETVNPRNYLAAWLAVVLALWSLPASLWGQSGAPDRKEDLQEIQRHLTKERQKIKEIATEEKSLLTHLSSMDRELAELKGELSGLSEKKAAIDDKISNSDLAIKELSARAAAQRRYLQQRIVAAYKYNNQGLLEILFSATSFPQFVGNMDYFRMVMDHDRHLFRDHWQTLNDLADEKQKLVAEGDRIAALQTTIAAKRNYLSGEEENKKELLSAIRNEKALHLRLVRELEETSRQLTQMIKGLESEVSKAAVPSGLKDFLAQKGNLPLPVAGQIISGFGKQVHPVFKTVIFQKGIEIEAPYSEAIRSVSSGQVAYVGWMRGYGQLIIISHGDHYYTLFAHASQVMVERGDQVVAGHVIAKVGDSGSLKGPCLYFEIRHYSEPVNPIDWLDRKQIKYAKEYQRPQ